MIEDKPTKEQRIEMLEIQINNLIKTVQKLDSRIKNLENQHE